MSVGAKHSITIGYKNETIVFILGSPSTIRKSKRYEKMTDRTESIPAMLLITKTFPLNMRDKTFINIV
jgi:hypothetical protein